MVNRIEIDLNALSNNLRVFRKAIDPDAKIIGVVKANAYGHGLVETARAVWTAGADILAVATMDEAAALRVAKIRAPILVLSYIDPSDFRRMIDFDVTATVYNFQTALKISQEAIKLNKWAKVDLKIDTGMNRFGVTPTEAVDFYQKVFSLEHIKITGIHSHFTDGGNREFVKEQLNQMQNVLFSFQRVGIVPPLVHMAATEATLKFPETHFGAIRPGLGLYGYCGFNDPNCELQPVLELKTVIAQIRRVGRGETIGYMREFMAEKPMKIAVLPIGYSDGYPRSLTNKGEVLVSTKRAKVVGRVCMNITMVDVTGISCNEGDEVVLIGSQGSGKVYADEVAAWAGTNPHEILSRLSPLLPREYHFK